MFLSILTRSLFSSELMQDVRLSENPIADPGQGGIPRFGLIARLAKVEVLNGSEVSFTFFKSTRYFISSLISNYNHGR